MGFFISGTTKYSFEVIRRKTELHEYDLPLLINDSRKQCISGTSKVGILNFTERDITDAVVPSIALC